ncbi:hypothetical protein SUGI_1033470 [Cryptomeria japonica]|uniref:uncharacterized protein At3g49055 n=1 Tax=Cryptomeria japonica TaxID=3369 RepID=UPI002414CE88|nr:uncharacterized protein At3g49055 [Cryptomeria japonica]XP_057841181.1 uncharacterized protein At3g49055 [Cryptomeria japonica]GLJ48984.1 hypothetical protein SUGI_1033470 [Cryptomeria japonica]
MEGTGEEDAALSDFEDGDLEAAPVVLQPNSSDDTAESLKKALLELESEREARKAAENAKSNLESTFGKMKGLAHEAIKKRDEFSRQRDDALRQKEEALREKESIAKQLEEALRLKEEACKQRDEALKQRNDLARQKDEILRLKDEATKARESSRSEIEATAQLLINGAEKITSKVGSIKSFNGGLPRTSKHTGLVAIAYGAMKRADEIVEELVRQHEIITKGRNDVREQMEQRNIAIAIEVSQLEATITGLKEELGSKCMESENLQKLVLNKDGRISELESDISEKLDQERKEYKTLKRFTDETEDKLKNLELKIEKQKPIISDQLVCISKAQECLKNMVQMIDASASDQFEFSEPLFVSQDLDIDKDLVASSAGAIFISELTTMVEKKLMAHLEKQSKEMKDLEDNIVNLEAEKRDISTLLRSALRERQIAETEGDGEYQTGSEQRKGTILQVAERDLGLDFSGGAHVGNNGTEKGQDEFFGLASALEHIIRTSQLEIAELRHSLGSSRAELNHLRVVSETQTKDLAAKVLRIKELEEKERAASENVEGLMMDIAAAEEEIARWRNAAEQEAAAGKAVMEEFQEEIKTLRQDLEEMRQSLDEANSKLKSKEEMAAAAVAARDTAEKSLQLADERASRLRARIEELTRQLEESDGGDEQQNIRRMRYACWPLQWLGTGTLGAYFTAYRDANGNSAEMELSDPLL